VTTLVTLTLTLVTTKTPLPLLIREIGVLKL